MKTMKKALALLLAVVMVAAMGVTSFADDPGSITVRNATVGQDYKAYKVFDLTYEAPAEYDAYGDTTSPVSYSYTDKSVPEDTTTDPVTPAVPDKFFAALDAKKVEDPENAGEYIASPFELVESSTAGVYNVQLADGATVEDIIAFLKACEAQGLLTQVGATQTANSDKVVFDNLDYGYYYVTSSLGSEVTIDSTTKDVTIVDKNEEPGNPEDPDPDPDYDPEDPFDPTHPSPKKVYAGKQIVDDKYEGGVTKANTADYGDYIHFGYSVHATAYADPLDEENGEKNQTGLVTYYYIEDVMEEGFDIVKSETKVDSVVVATAPIVRVIKQNGSIEVLTEGEDYTITYSASAQDVAATPTDADEAFLITVPWGEKYGNDATITVDYFGYVTENAVIASTGNPNTAKFAYDTAPLFDPDNRMIPNPEFDPISDPDSPNYDPDNPNYDPDQDPNVNPNFTPDPTSDDYNPYSDPNSPLYDPDNPAYDPTHDRTKPDVFDPDYGDPDPLIENSDHKVEIPNPDYDPISDPNNDEYYDPTSEDYDPTHDPSDLRYDPNFNNNPTIPAYDPADPTDPNFPKDNVTPTPPSDGTDPVYDPLNPGIDYPDGNADGTVTYVYALAVVKIDKQGEALSTAKFTLERKVGEDEDKNPIWAPVHVKAVTGDNAGVYRYDASTSATNYEITTPDSTATGFEGEIVVKGLEAGIYQLTETVAPKGYNLLLDPLTVEIEQGATYSEKVIGYFDAEGFLQASEVTGGSSKEYIVDEKVCGQVIQNLNGTELPSTGGIGTTIFYILGGVLLVGAAVLLITKKRMSSEE